MTDRNQGNQFARGFGTRDYLNDYLTGRENKLRPAINIAGNNERYTSDI